MVRPCHFFEKPCKVAERVDGVIITDDVMTQGALIALQKLNVPVGHGKGKLNIVSHSNAGSTTLMGREEVLTLVETDPRDVVQAMFDQLEIVMAGQKPAQTRIKVRARLKAV